MGHLKRQAAPKSWPIHRKGTKFIVGAGSKGVPLLIVLRDMLEIARTRREVKKALIKKDIIVSGKAVKDEKLSLNINDIVTLVPSKKSFKITLSDKGKFKAEEIPEKESNEKISKIVGKKILKGKKIQFNLLDGKNYLGDDKCKVNDSIVLDLKTNKIKKYLPLTEKAKAFVIGGKHAGKEGIIEKIDLEKKISELKLKDEKINVLVKDLMVIE